MQPVRWHRESVNAPQLYVVQDTQRRLGSRSHTLGLRYVGPTAPQCHAATIHKRVVRLLLFALAVMLSDNH